MPRTRESCGGRPSRLLRRACAPSPATGTLPASGSATSGSGASGVVFLEPFSFSLTEAAKASAVAVKRKSNAVRTVLWEPAGGETGECQSTVPY